MKYITFDKDSDQLKWSKVYCNKNGNETALDIILATLPYDFLGEFHSKDHLSAGCPKIKNDDNLFIIRNKYGSLEIWQVGGKVSDMTGAIIPNLYKVRQIGYMFE